MILIIPDHIPELVWEIILYYYYRNLWQSKLDFVNQEYRQVFRLSQSDYNHYYFALERVADHRDQRFIPNYSYNYRNLHTNDNRSITTFPVTNYRQGGRIPRRYFYSNGSKR